jgi:hypothetical protein
MGLESNAIKRPKDAGIDCAEEGFLSRFPSLFFIIIKGRVEFHDAVQIFMIWIVANTLGLIPQLNNSSQ